MQTIKDCEDTALKMFDEVRYFDNDFENLNVETVSHEADETGDLIDWHGVVTYTMGMLGDEHKFAANVALNEDGEVSVYTKNYDHEVGNGDSVPWVYTMVELAQAYKGALDKIHELEGDIEVMDYQQDME